MERLWERMSQGRHCVVVGRLPLLPVELQGAVVRVACDGPSRPMGPIVEASTRMRARLDKGPLDIVPSWVPAGLRSRLLGEEEPSAPMGTHVEVFNRYAEKASGSALLLERLDRADPSTFDFLRRVLAKPGWLELPLVLHFEDTEPHEVFLEAVGPEGLFRDVPLISAAGWEPTGLDRDLLRTLRAGALLGAVFEAPAVAELLGLPLMTVLDDLQHAYDLGAPIIDRGDGLFSLPADAHEVLQRGLLPSVARAWHLRAAELFGAPDDFFDSVLHEAEADDMALPETVAPPAPDEWTPIPVRSEARAARHFEEAGATQRAAERYLTAAHEANAAGAVVVALQHASAVLDHLAMLPQEGNNRRLKVAALTELGRVQWQAVGPESDFSLAAAGETLMQALELLDPSDPAELSGDVRQALATVLFDLGDLGSLERALEELTQASRDYMASGDSLGAARLLNDQAAVYVRLGDPVRANHLLEESRAVFEGAAEDDADAARELAETDLLIARLPLHVGAKPGRGREALDLGLDHARRAADGFELLRCPRGLGRALETTGRLASLAGDDELAVEALEKAAVLQQRIDDAMGLARTTAARAELLQREGRTADALHLLRESIALNRAKGSPLGLAFNRRTLHELEPAAREGHSSRAASELMDAQAELEAAELLHGRGTMPPSVDDRPVYVD